MFSERYGLEQGVLAGTKTMTRRILKEPKKFKGVDDTMLEFRKRLGHDYYYDCVVCDMDGREIGQMPLPYEIGDVVAIAQRYNSIAWHANPNVPVPLSKWMEKLHRTAGWNNKMFVKSELMPWQIVIEDLWFERLQDISDEDIMREGIMEGEFMNTWDKFYFDFWGDVPNHITFPTARKAFAKLIDYINGTGTWDSNPWVVAYSFRLQRAQGFLKQQNNNITL